MGRAALFYAAFVVYGSLVPLDWKARPLAEAWRAFLDTPYLQLGVASRADWVANILLYIPLAFFLTAALARRRRGAAAALLSFGACAALAVAIEFAQLFFPPRTVSLNDMIAEVMGSVIGIVSWQVAGERLLERWKAVLHGGAESARAFIALYTAAYILYALFPYDFLVSARELAAKLANPNTSALFMAQSCSGLLSCGGKLASEIIIVAPLGAFLGMMAGRGRAPSLPYAFGWGLLLGAMIEGLQVFLASGISQGASILSRGLGAALGLAAYRWFRPEWLIRRRRQMRWVVLAVLPLYAALLLALMGFFSAPFENRWMALAKLDEVRFLPFYYHYFTSETQAMHSLLVYAGAYAPIGVIAWIFSHGRAGRSVLWVSAIAALLVAAGMETLKLFLHGRKPDPTDALIAAAAAALACFLAGRLSQPKPPARSDKVALRSAAPLTSHRRGRSFALLAGLGASGVALAGWLIGVQPREHYVDESTLPQLPAPETLPPPYLPRFKTAHPRLPSPTATELDLLRRYGGNFIGSVQSRASGGAGDFHSIALQELLKPGSIDLALLHKRLMSLKFHWRGDSQVKPLSVAYDWLYDRWSPSQRALLRSKLVEGCDYVVHYIRKERLSPYNVILYNSPLQALMACSIALYGDDPRGDALMAFAQDMWKNRVLPVWRQVMGRNGGWPEGGEYVGIGIGQAIYQLPAMWREATGEAVFAAEPGIRGFLDFLVYRIRPDGTHFRWGDGAWFDKGVPDAVPLALELKHAAAYSLQPTPDTPRPSGWPWGPLTDATLFDASAHARLPLTRLFDGIGLVVARSDWSPNATYVTFKAGDNYWSHEHLDQGAFTIYKGGPLAIDSGLYGPTYGSDHHMNYTYQTIAHNTITITDPADTAPAPGPEEFRSIANDGGQRRVGSGWGLEAAPLDLAEWQAKRDIYHTGTLEQLLDADGITLAVADITPAYTNSRSGEGTFSARTRRVERFWRIFGYDRIDDAVVVFDNVVGTKASFRKRWLLHTLEAPKLKPGGFSVTVAPQNRPGRGGGRLEARVLLPKQARINAVGGSGFQFFVDGRNYDEGGKLEEIVKRLGPTQGEPGAWRIEVSPAHESAEELFLVVMFPGSATPASHNVRLLESAGRVGCEIVGSKRTTRWWFDRERNAVEVEVAAGGRVSRHRAEGRSSEPPARRGWIARLRNTE